jgi:putative two-component system response regulator
VISVGDRDKADRKGVVVAIDDDAINLARIGAILGATYDVRLCKSGKMALVVLAETKADLILLDIEMPGMSGFDFMEEMKARFPDLDVPVIFVTSHATPGFISTAARHGAKGYVIKPFEPVTLLTKVQEFLSDSDSKSNSPLFNLGSEYATGM